MKHMHRHMYIDKIFVCILIKDNMYSVIIISTSAFSHRVLITSCSKSLIYDPLITEKCFTSLVSIFSISLAKL